jgi:hypothetical protein
MRIMNNLCLVKLAPAIDRTASGILLEPAMTPPICYGKVVQVGPKATSVAVGDIVAFPPSEGESLEGFFPTPHVLIRDSHLSAVIERQAVI